MANVTSFASGLPPQSGLSSSDPLHRRGQLEVLGRDAARVMRGEVDSDGAPHVEPFGVMVHPLGDQRDARHEAERLDEIAELVLAVKLSVLQRTARDLRQSPGDL